MELTCPNCDGEYVPICPCGDGPADWRPGDLGRLVAERDRLQARTEEYEQRVRDLVDESTAERLAAHTELTAVEAERDRLRAVVDAAVEAVAAHRAWIAKARTSGVTTVDAESHRRAAALATLGTMVDQLDGSEVMGDG